MLGPHHRFFFAGDTGYCPVFQEIGRRFGPFDLAAIPIGAYTPRFCTQDTLYRAPHHFYYPESFLPRDVMKGQHVDPEQAVQIHQDLQAKHSVAIHWGTFALAYEVRTETHHSLLPLHVGVEFKGEGDGVGRYLPPSLSYPPPLLTCLPLSPTCSSTWSPRPVSERPWIRQD